MNQVQNCSELTTHTKIDFKRSSAPRLNIAQVAWSPPGLYGLSSAKAAEKFPESKNRPRNWVEDPTYPVSTSLKKRGSPGSVPRLACPGSVALKQPGSPGSTKSPRSNHTKKKTKFEFYSKINLVQTCSELTTHTEFFFQKTQCARSQHRSSSGEIPSVSPSGLYGLNSAKVAGKSPESKIAPN